MEGNSNGFVSGLITSFSMIILSELGDKTFIFAAIMAMKNPRLAVFSGATTALGLMTILSGKYIFTWKNYLIEKLLRIFLNFILSFVWGHCDKHSFPGLHSFGIDLDVFFVWNQDDLRGNVYRREEE